MTFAFVVTFTVEIANCAEDIPCGTVTDGGTEAPDPCIDNVTVIPPAGAIELSDTLPIAEFPPFTVVGETLKPDKVGGLIVRFV